MYVSISIDVHYTNYLLMQDKIEEYSSDILLCPDLAGYSTLPTKILMVRHFMCIILIAMV